MQLVAATTNPGKIEEIGRILAPLGIEIVPQSQLCPGLEVEETGSSFAENARLKAMAVFEATGLPSLADDSGLCVDALDGAPGIYSARYAGAGASDQTRWQKLLTVMEGIPQQQRTARFVCAVCLVLAPGDEITCEAASPGEIAFAPQGLGQGGFGYDPVFLVDGKSYAEMSDKEKDKISHRGLALAALYEQLQRRIQV